MKDIKMNGRFTIEKVKNEFEIHNKFYFDARSFEGNKNYCDIYINHNESEITSFQINVFNDIISNHRTFVTEAEKHLISVLKKGEKLKDGNLQIQVLEIPSNPINFDAVLIFGKRAKKYGFYFINIGLRMEIQNGAVKTIMRKSNTTIENKQRNFSTFSSERTTCN